MNATSCREKGARRIAGLIALVFACVIASVVAAQLSAIYDLSWAILSGGGGSSYSENHRVQDVMGQSMAGISESETTRIESGFLAGMGTTAEDEYSFHTADQDHNNRISLSELLRVIQFFNSGGLHCADPPESTEDGYTPGPDPGHQACAAHACDYNPQNWIISLSELLRIIQFFNSGGYRACPAEGTEDGYCVGLPT